MRRAALYGRSVAMQGSPYTLLVYRAAFGGDLLADLVEAYRDDVPDTTTLLQAAWAMCRTLDDGVADFPEWLREFDPMAFALDDADALGVIDSAIAAEPLRGGKARGARERAARLLDSLAQRLGALARRLLAR